MKFKVGDLVRIKIDGRAGFEFSWGIIIEINQSTKTWRRKALVLWQHQNQETLLWIRIFRLEHLPHNEINATG